MSTSGELALPPKLASESDSLVERAEKFEIVGPEQFADAGGLLRSIKSLAKEISDAFAEPIRAAHAAHKAALAARDRYLKPVNAAERTLKNRMSTWQRAEDERRRAEQARLEAEARARAEEARRAEAMMAARDGDEEEAEAIMAAPPPAEAPSVAEDRVPAVEGVSTRQVWRWRLVDATALPREYLVPDDKKISAVVRAMGSLARIPGVETYQETVVAAKAAGS